MILINAIAIGLSVLIIEFIIFLPTVASIDAEPLNDLSAQLLPQPITSQGNFWLNSGFFIGFPFDILKLPINPKKDIFF